MPSEESSQPSQEPHQQQSSSSSSSSDDSSSSESKSSSSSYDSSSSSYDSDSSASDSSKKVLQTAPKEVPPPSTESSSVDLPCYEEFMPSTRGEVSNTQIIPVKSATNLNDPPASSSSKADSLSREDWIEILTEALDRSSKREESRKRSKVSDSEQTQGEEEEDDSTRVLGSLSASVVSSGGSNAGKKVRLAQQPQPLPEPYKTSRKSATSASQSKQAAAWKRKLTALQKAQVQLSAKISALIDLSSD
jgi:hypothetical protein